MRNPFHFFRKNQKALLAVFGVLLMIVFTVGGVVSQFFPQRAAYEAADKVVVKIDGQPLTKPEIDRLSQDATLVSLVTGMAMARTQEAGGFPNPPAPPIAGLRYQPPSGPNSPGGAMREEISTQVVISDHLFSLEGERLGVAISDDMVREFMTSVTGGVISDVQYAELLNQAQGADGRVTYDQMFEMFRRTLLVQKTKRLLLEGISTATPASAWINYRNLNRTLDVQLYPVNTADYLAKVTKKPTEAELKKLFNQYRDQIRNPLTGEPGFLQLDKAAVGFVKADYEKFLEAELAKITDEQVAADYEKNKDSSYRKPVADPAAETPLGVPATEPAMEEQPAATEPMTTEPMTTEPMSTEPMKTEPAAEKPAEDKPAAEPAKMEEPAKEAPAEEKTMTETPPATEKSAEEKPAPEAPAEEKPADEKPAAEESSLLGRGSEVMLVAFQEEGEKPAEDKPSEEKPATEKPADDAAPAAEPMKETPAETKPMEEMSAPMDETKPTDESPMEEAPVEYRPLEEVKDQIKASLARPLAQAAVKDALQKVSDVLQREYDDYFYADEQNGNPFDDLDLKKLAQEHGVEYGEMPMMDYIAAMESPYGEITHAEFSYNPQQGGLQRNDRRFVDFIFGNKSPLYRPQEFPGASSSSMFSMPADQQFVFWKTDESKGFLPTFDQVRDQVVEAWKLQQAAKLAEAEAEKIAASAQGDAPLNEVVPVKDAVLVADNITYYQEIRQPGQYNPAQIPGVEKTGLKTLDKIFATPVGATVVAPNADETVWYVARVTGERKTEAELRDQLKAEMNGDFPFSVAYLEGMRSQVRWNQVQEDLFERFNVEWQSIADE